MTLYELYYSTEVIINKRDKGKFDDILEIVKILLFMVYELQGHYCSNAKYV